MGRLAPRSDQESFGKRVVRCPSGRTLARPPSVRNVGRAAASRPGNALHASRNAIGQTQPAAEIVPLVQLASSREPILTPMQSIGRSCVSVLTRIDRFLDARGPILAPRVSALTRLQCFLALVWRFLRCDGRCRLRARFFRAVHSSLATTRRRSEAERRRQRGVTTGKPNMDADRAIRSS